MLFFKTLSFRKIQGTVDGSAAESDHWATIKKFLVPLLTLSSSNESTV